MTKRKVIIDCDPGIDDAVAILYALAKEELEVLSIHTTSGNTSLNYTSQNACGLLSLAGVSDIPVYKGAEHPIVYEPVFAGDVHGEDGMLGYKWENKLNITPEEKTALEAYVDILSNTKEKVTIIAVGPLTNVAILLLAYPELKEKIECISIMGGGIKGGNYTICGEFNFYVDPHAAHIVFTSGIDIIMAGLDVTEIARLHEVDYQEVESFNPEIGEFLLHTASDLFEISESINRGRTLAPNDLVSVMVLTKPEIFKLQDEHVSISYESGFTRGMTIRDTRKRVTPVPNCKVIYDVDKDIFRKEFITSLKSRYS